MKKKANFHPQKDTNIGNKYLLKDFIDEGSFGYVWKATNLETNQIVALKIPKDQERGDNTLSEGKEFVGSTHPNVVSIFWIGRVDGVFVIEMEYFNGHKLSDELNDSGFKSPRTFADIHKLYLQILCGVEYIHDKHICHGDIKPQNILLNNNHAKITDFGTSKLIEDLFIKTIDGGGTWAYLAPEVAGSNKRYLNSDIYALGVLLYKFVTGRTPHDTANQLINNIPYPKPREINDNVSESLERVILKALQRNPEDRYGSIQELRIDLEAAMSSNDNEILNYNKCIKPIIRNKDWMEAVIGFYKTGEHKKAELLLKHEMENDNKTQDVLYHFAYTNFLQGMYYESLELLKNIDLSQVEGIRRNAFEDNLLYLNGKVQLELKKYDEAISFFRRLVEKNPANLDYRYKLACVYGLNNEEDEAIKMLEDINKQTPGMLYIVKKLGHAYDQKKDYNKARGFFNYALRLDPKDAKIRHRIYIYEKYL